MISYPLPSWEPMNTVPFMYAESTWDEWSTGFIELMLGLGMFLLSISAITREAPWMSFRFDSNHPLQVLQFKFIKYSAMSSVFIASVLIVIYSFGANLYACGTPWLRTTIAYVSDAPLIEWLTACMYCVFATYVAYFITKIRILSAAHLKRKQNEQVSADTSVVDGVLSKGEWIAKYGSEESSVVADVNGVVSVGELSQHKNFVSADMNGDCILSKEEWITQFGSEKGFVVADVNDDGNVSFDKISERHLTWPQFLSAVILYFPALCLLSTFTIIDVISKAVPPGSNIFGFSAAVLTFA